MARVYDEWPRVQVLRVQGLSDTVAAGTEFDVEADVALGGLHADEVEVHLAHGLLDGEGVLAAPSLTPLKPLGPARENGCTVSGYEASTTERSGRHGYAIRVTPTPSVTADAVPARAWYAGATEGEETGDRIQETGEGDSSGLLSPGYCALVAPRSRSERCSNVSPVAQIVRVTSRPPYTQ